MEEPKPLGSSLAALFGYIYIQDRSSMLPPLALNPPAGAAVLDMCASPGSKSGFLAQLVGKNGFVLANEPNPQRLGTLRANMHAANFLQVGTCSFAGEKIPLREGSLEYILLDPPCSGWGTVEKNPHAIKIWQGSKLRVLQNLQRRLLDRAAFLLAPGGCLLYSTCTTNPAENEAQTRYVEEKHGLERVALQPFAGFCFDEQAAAEGCLLVRGRDSRAQGFYLSLLRKPGTSCISEASVYDIPGDSEIFAANFSPVWNRELLAPGTVSVFGDKLRFLPGASTKIVPLGFGWQGALLGTINKKGATISPRLHALMRTEVDETHIFTKIVVEDVAQIRALLEGRDSGIIVPGSGQAALWWRRLPLAVVSIKSGRIILPGR